ncbi:DoxX family protein [Labrys sp. KNU-23]|uniref:DoxX family protein n=1 Tax=Labrys sp. KNU-23 TaxID=2789216 RepID=UPI0011EDB81F|nr:DoxX family protein [Labrys sp. KNU-23]QEN87864.1 DoxX family protein [Labrys sp. KNU-23]
MSHVIAAILGSTAFLVFARILLTFVFWSSGLAKLIDFNANAAIMESFGLRPGWLINAATLVLQLGASAAIILNRGAWLAASALAVFTLLTIPLVHPFWTKTGEEALRDLTVALEHLSLIGGLALAAILARRTPSTVPASAQAAPRRSR